MNRLKLLGLNQNDIASFLSISVPAYSYYENEKRDIPTEVLGKLSNFYNVSTDYILGLTNERKEKNDLQDNLFLIPIVGKVPAGEPLLAEENISGYLPIAPMMYHLTSPDNLFFLKVIGEFKKWS